MPFEFCDVDLTVRSDSPVDAITTHLLSFGDRVSVLHSGEIEPGKYLAAFEVLPHRSLLLVDAEGDPINPEPWGFAERIAAFCELLASLPPVAKAQWDAAASRTFDMGYEADDHCQPLKVDVTPETLRMVLQIGAQITFSVYPHTSFGTCSMPTEQP